MADVSDVYNTLAEWISNLLYPNGPQNPSTLTYNGAPVAFRVYPGWPVTQNLNADLASGVVNVNVYPRPEEVNVSTLPSDWEITDAPTPTLTASVSGLSVTIGGTVTAGEVVTIFFDGTAQSITAQSTDTLDTIASARGPLAGIDGVHEVLPEGRSGSTDIGKDFRQDAGARDREGVRVRLDAGGDGRGDGVSHGPGVEGRQEGPFGWRRIGVHQLDGGLRIGSVGDAHAEDGVGPLLHGDGDGGSQVVGRVLDGAVGVHEFGG